MKEISIFKAQGTEVESVVITIDRTVPDPPKGRGWEPPWRDVLNGEAEKLADALCNSLPGGVIDALLVQLLDRKRSMFIVPSFRKEGKDDT